MTIFFPVSTTTLANLPEVAINQNNESLLDIVVIDNEGFTSKVPLTLFRDAFKPTEISELVDILEPNTLLGRYSPESGPIQAIQLSDDFTVDGGILNLNTTVAITGSAGGDFEGTYPSPTLRDGTVSLQKFVELNGQTLIGRSESTLGPMQEIQLSADLIIEEGQLKLTGNSGISSTGFATSIKTEDFTAVATSMYIIEATGDIEVEVETVGNLGDQIIFINKTNSSVNIKLISPQNDIILNSQKRVAHIVRDNSNRFYDISGLN